MLTSLFLATVGQGGSYQRMTLPARAVGGQAYDLLDYIQGKATAQEAWQDVDVPTVWQLVTRHCYQDMMMECRELTGQPVYVESDDNYLVDMSGYLQGVVPLSSLHPDSTGVWVLEDVPPIYYGVDSPVVHENSVQRANGVIVATENLATFYRQHSDNVFVCRNGVDPDDWPQFEPRVDGVFRIVFAGSSTLRNLTQIREGMIWAANQPSVEVWFVGYRAKLLRWKGLREQTYFDNPADYRYFMGELQPDVWLRPTDASLFAQGKSDLKILEAAMVGALPIVTPGEAYGDWFKSDVLFAADKQDWTTQIEWCLDNRDEVKMRAQNIREVVLRDRGIATIKEDWSKVLCSSGK